MLKVGVDFIFYKLFNRSSTFFKTQQHFKSKMKYDLRPAETLQEGYALYLPIFRVSSHLSRCYGNHVRMNTEAKGKIQIITSVIYWIPEAFSAAEWSSWLKHIERRTPCERAWETAGLFPGRDEKLSQHAPGGLSLFTSQMLPARV